ncbi:MAG: tetratricopeptide repeat-containing sensor histidine kinase [Bacteroidota bacterium]
MYEHRRDAALALRTGQEAYDRAVNMQDTLLQIRALNAIGASRWMLGRYDLAVREHTEALRLAEKLHSSFDIGQSNNNLGLAYRNLGMDERAEGCFRESVRIRTLLNDGSGLSRSLMNLGLVLYERAQFDSAYALHERSLRLARNINDSLLTAGNLYYLGRNEKERGRTAEALRLMHEGLNLYLLLGDRNGISLSSSDIARLLLKTGRTEEAKQMAMEALKNALLLNSRFAIRDATEVLTSVYAAQKEYQKAYEYLTLFRATDDSLRSESALLHAAQIDIEREIGLREKELAFEAEQKERALQSTLRSAAFVRNSLIAGTVLLAAVVALLLFAYRSKQKSNMIVMRQNSRIEEANAELSREIETRERLFSIVGHDLRGPVGNIAGMLEFVTKDVTVTPGERKELLDAARESAQASHALLNRLLDWAHAQRKEIQFNPEPGDMHETAQSVITLLEQQAKAKDLRLTWDCPLELRFAFDAHMMTVIIENLLSNAIKFTSANGHVQLQIMREADRCTILVKDNGRGMNPERVERIRNRSRISPEPGTAHEAGHGLGLDLCYRLTALHGGELSVESELGKGTVFSLHIPLR